MNRVIDLGMQLLQRVLVISPNDAEYLRDMMRRGEDLKRQNTLVMNLLLLEEEAQCRRRN
jgi:hypothetical protein